MSANQTYLDLRHLLHNQLICWDKACCYQPKNRKPKTQIPSKAPQGVATGRLPSKFHILGLLQSILVNFRLLMVLASPKPFLNAAIPFGIALEYICTTTHISIDYLIVCRHYNKQSWQHFNLKVVLLCLVSLVQPVHGIGLELRPTAP